MEDGEPPASGRSTDPKEDHLDQGRRYWKAAIAHLAPEKREAAWEFYLDRLESSAAADTLGGVMLLLEAHLAFFDDLPARLGMAAQRFESALQSLNRESALPEQPSPSSASDRPIPSPTGRTRRSSPVTIGIALLLGAVAGCVGTIAHEHFRSQPPAGRSIAVQDGLFPRGQPVAIEPWDDPATGRRKGCIVRFSRAAATERSAEGEAKIYLQSPVEEVRENVRALRQLAP